MANIALLLAGGVGSRMKADVPKQFIEVNGRPIITYTLEAFDRHPLIDGIAVVCLEGWEDRLTAYAKEYGVTKLRWVVPGGATSQESIRNGVYALEAFLDQDDIVIVHDGIRPLVEAAVLTDTVGVCLLHGNAVAALPYNEQIFKSGDGESTSEAIPRDGLFRVSTPQAYRYGLLLEKYREAFKRGIGVSPSSYTNTMMTALGVRLWFSRGSEKNIKLTTAEDIDIFKALLAARREREA